MSTTSVRQHILLIGIDAYQKVDPLHGCVNDVDALETLFLNRLAVEPSAITKLVAPHAAAIRNPRVGEDKPTADNIRQALEALGSDMVRPGDRVFIHYSGHGTQLLPRASRTAREALVPWDTLAGGEPLLDYEVNELLRRIAERTRDLTVILDCCCSAGATRSTFVRHDGSIRFCSIDAASKDAVGERYRSGGLSTNMFSALEPSDPGFLVVTSAQSCEAAHEGRDSRGVRHGAFTAALLDLLGRESAENIPGLRWADVWQSLRARVTTAFPGQHPCLIGRSERYVFGGPFEPRDAGLSLDEIGAKYQIHAGKLAGLGVGATVAMYGSEPSFFPPINSAQDMAVRHGLLRVESATLSSALAVPVGPTFRMQKGARGRLVKPGPADKLVVGLDPFNADLARYLESDAPVIVVPLAERGAHELEAVIGSFADGSYWLGDDIFGPDAPLVRITANNRAALSRALWHYSEYNLPLRLVRRNRELVGALRLRVLDAQRANMLDAEELPDPPLPEVDSDSEGRYRYRLLDGQPVCFSVENRTNRPLYTQIFNCSASGRVEMLGPSQLEVPGHRRLTFWMGGRLGTPFPCRVSVGRVWNVERLVAVGTASPEIDLQSLRVRESFSEAMSTQSRDASSGGDWANAWTATMIPVRIDRHS